ncbi:UDP-3-O-(3-hydroxymyristoyl)glucosamine N-acyltransferase [Rhodovulum adriaticum]|uniref:UDP-3-O-acylglucosamine N-acyltransferase n=1 Tax=Rhodovulum adriaticum TaxID=35804 RepID=A0A4R2NVJ4_RHOAD|nr:UDP-3-O-(3-hydroxymyristoyl)glucosamine N-acyltransferase [Rhodovulum adriaticum]MBK1635625.1 UDP-3-O-(3-hydroxymyristoyl)glucosamine N-acyltransferase [Rhodovulum adriaticum]TCP26139.1 UDP-3-O-[3-hydroxymyristoyl] glucosamine N-acyltransferase [Rhodovulum adriaticum]
MVFTVQQIATALGARVEGDAGLTVQRAAEPAQADAQALALAMDPKYAEGLAQGAARAAILWDGADWQALGLRAAIFVPRPRYAMSGLTRLMDPGPEIAPGIHPTAVIDPTAQIGPGAAIGPFVVIGARVVIGQGARIAAHASVAEDARIGDDALILQGVRIGARVRIGHRFIAQPGAVVGSDGFSFVTLEKSAVENVRESLGDTGDAAKQGWTRIHSLGAVSIGDDVELGANCCIDRGTIRDTVIGSGTKLDNLVHVGHNVRIGRDCLLCGQVGIAGSSRIGDRVVFAGQVGVNDNIFVGDDVIAGGATKIFSNAPAGRVLLGYPAMRMDTHVEVYKGLRRLPRLFAQVAALQKAVSKRPETD